jgi:hypothetical protein
MARKKSNGPKAQKNVTRYTYDEIKELRTRDPLSVTLAAAG